MKTRDGSGLVCDVVRPDDSRPHPLSSPDSLWTLIGDDQRDLLGEPWIVFVSQDCRGREDSGGNWDPFVNEGPDGADAIAWIASNRGATASRNDRWELWRLRSVGRRHRESSRSQMHRPQVSPPDAMHNIPTSTAVFALYPDLWLVEDRRCRKTDSLRCTVRLPAPTKSSRPPPRKARRSLSVLGEHLAFFDKWLSRNHDQNWKLRL